MLCCGQHTMPHLHDGLRSRSAHQLKRNKRWHCGSEDSDEMALNRNILALRLDVLAMPFTIRYGNKIDGISRNESRSSGGICFEWWPFIRWQSIAV